jgi:hypothetical protein
MEPSLVEEVGLQPEEIAVSAEDNTTVGEEERLEEETVSAEEVDQTEIETLAQKRDGTIPKGVPPKMDVNIESLEFGIVGKPENTRHFSVANSGGAPLVVSIRAEEWINVSHLQFVLAPGEKQMVTATLNAKYPHPKTGQEFRAAFALDIESNAGSEVIGARYVIPRPPFYATGWKRAILGAAIGIIFACIFAFLLEITYANELSCVVVPAIPFLFGLAGFASYPRKASLLFSIAGLVVAGILAGLLISVVYELQEIAIAILGLAIGLGVLGGAILSRVIFRRTRPPQASK